MRKTMSTLFACSLLLLAVVSCGGSSDDAGAVEPPDTDPDTDTAAEAEVIDDQTGDADPPDAFGDPLDASDEMTIVAAIRDRTTADGAEYDFGAMEPVFAEGDDTIEVTFRYRDANTRGGAPTAVISRTSGDISSIRYGR